MLNSLLNDLEDFSGSHLRGLRLALVGQYWDSRIGNGELKGSLMARLIKRRELENTFINALEKSIKEPPRDA